MSKLPTLHVYVSYSTDFTDELSELKESIAVYNDSENNSFQMEIRYSEKNVQEGESIVKFMEEIASARFVVMLFSQAYFQSPYCLFELIMACEKQKDDSRIFILPIHSKINNSGKNFGDLKVCIKKWINEDLNPACLIELSGLFKKQKIILNDAQIKEKIQNIYNDYLDPKLDYVTFDKTSDEIVLELEQNAKEAFELEKDSFNSKIFEKIIIELGKIPNLDASWGNYSTIALKKNEIAKKISEPAYFEALIEIQKWAKVEFARQSNGWPVFFRHVQSIAGWIILKSINQDWWINNKLFFTDGVSNKSLFELCLDEDQFSYSEVVVSRGLIDIKPARFLLDEDRNLIPNGKENILIEDGSFVLDTSKGAELSILLTPIYKDLKGKTPKTDEPKMLLKEIINLAFGNTGIDNSGIIFYLVDAKFLSKLKEHQSPFNNNKKETVLDVINRELKGKLFFIVIDAELDENGLQVSDFTERPLSLMHNILLIDPP